MTVQEILAYAKKNTNRSYDDIALGAGIKDRSNTIRSLKAKNLRATTFVRLLNAMGYEIYIRDKSGEGIQVESDTRKVENDNATVVQRDNNVVVKDNKIPLSKTITNLDELLS